MEAKNEDYGLIYGLTNPYFKGMVKIGATRNLDINKRMRVLGIAVPKPFECAFAYKVPVKDLFAIENRLHKTFGYCRIEGSEFFEIDYHEVNELLRMIGKFEPMKTIVQNVINAEEAKRKNPNMDFVKMGLHIGDTIRLIKNPLITCTIATHRKVLYQGDEVSLSSITYKLLGYKRPVQPSPYWETTEGISLSYLYLNFIQQEEMLNDNIQNNFENKKMIFDYSVCISRSKNHMTPPNKDIFYAEVYDIVRQIPKGKVLTYGRIAELVGYPNHSRMVGKAMVNAPEGRDIPCHRVVHSNGGTCPAWKEQRTLLEQEGVHFKANGTIDMSKYLWQIEE